MTTLKDIIEEKKKFFDSVEARFKTGINTVFESVPELQQIKWQQYTPSFNDGEPCEHHLGEVALFLEIHEDNNVDDGIDPETAEGLSEESRKLLQDFLSEFSELDDVLKKIFDTNKEITINRDGNVKIEDYDCEY